MPPLDAPKLHKVRILQWFLILAIGVLGLWQFHIPQFASKFDKFPGDRGDARLVAYLMEHWYQVFHGAVSWRSPASFYPVEGTIGYADLLLGYGVVYSGLRTTGMGIFEAAEFTIILFNFLNYLVCFVLLNKVLRFNLFASIAGAAFFAFNSPKLVQLPHLQLQPILFLPLAMIGIVLLFQKRETLNQKQAFGLIALSTLSLAVQLLTGFYPGWFFIFWSTLFLILTLLFTQTRNVVLDLVKRFWPAMLGSIAVFFVALVPFLLAYLPVLGSSGVRPYKEMDKLIPVPRSFLMMGPRNYLWASLPTAVNPDWELTSEVQIGIGLIPTLAWLALIVFAVWLLIRNLRTGVKRELLFLSQLILATTLVYALGMKYWNGFSPWQFVYAYFPGAQVVRAVARYALVLALPMGIAFAFLIQFLINKITLHTQSTRRTLLFAALFVLTTFGLVEQFGRKEGFDGFSISAENQYLNELAHSLPNDCSTFYVGLKPPIFHNVFEYQLDAMLVSTLKGLPTLNGYSGHLPPDWPLWAVDDPAYEGLVRKWIDDKKISGKVCRLFISEPRLIINIEDPTVFVRQQYVDILRREPDPQGLQSWVTQLTEVGGGTNKHSSRVNVSFAILESPEFFEHGHFVLRLYFATLGRLPLREEFVKDYDFIFSRSSAELESKKDALIEQFVERAEFKSRYGQLDDAAFVKQLVATHSSSEPGDKLVSLLQSKQNTRAQVARFVIDDPETVRTFRNPAFVLMQFFAHLARDPKPSEYDDRLKTLNATGDYRRLVFDFINSVEYRKRFVYVN
jgi:uncharacterized protein DUF4214